LDAHDEFLTLFLQHQSDLRAFIGAVLRDRAARDDLLQETALVLWKEFERYDRSRPFGAWARGIAAKKLLQRLDRGGPPAASLPDAAVPAILAAFDRSEGPADARRDALQSCLEGLAERSRRLLVLRYEQGYTVARLAKELGRSTEAIYKALARIRLKLRECIDRRLRAAGEL
jgi:RNA polymerase sigma-70 factor (ECF subfamily)